MRVFLTLPLVFSLACNGDKESDDTGSNNPHLDTGDADADGFSEADGDCDDENPEVNPDATEVCGDGIDNDCADAGCSLGLGDADAVMLGDVSGDGAGVAVVDMGDANGDGVHEMVIGVSGQDGAGADEGTVYVAFGPVLSGTRTLGADELQITGLDADGSTGVTLAGVGDIDGDGLADLAIGASTASTDAFQRPGKVYLLTGATLAAQDPTGDVSLSQAATVLVGESTATWLGTGLASAGDMDGDERADLLAAATGDNGGSISAGAVYLLTGLADLDAGEHTVSEVATAKLQGEEVEQYVGGALAAPGDLNGDGFADLAIGGQLSGFQGDKSGSVYLQLGPVSGTLSLADADARLDGMAEGDRAGSALGPAGDADGDGRADLWVGASHADTAATDAGMVYLVQGTENLGELSGSLETAASVHILGGAAGDALGAHLSGEGDVNGDGTPDLLVGASGLGAGGGALVFIGPLWGTIDAGTQATGTFSGESGGDKAGSMVAFAPGSGTEGDAILVGAPGSSLAGENAGAAYLARSVAE